MIKAVIFDLDGTLLNTLGDLTDAVNAAICPRGYAPATVEQVRQRVGNGVRLLIKRSLREGTPDAEIDACLDDFRTAYDHGMMNRTVPYEGISAMLNTLRQSGIRAAVLSNKYDPAAKALIAHYFPGQIELTFGERAGVPSKPDPTAVYEIMHTLAVAPQETLYVGDSGTDMETAKNAGLTAIGVTWGFRERQVISDSGADFIIDDCAALTALLTDFEHHSA